jgi:hypothetical protein
LQEIAIYGKLQCCSGINKRMPNFAIRYSGEILQSINEAPLLRRLR